MKAVQLRAYGGVDQLEYGEAPAPVVSEPDEVIVELRAASLNHIDIWNRMGATGITVAMPHILGADGAGVVAEVGNGVQGLRVGDEVCLYPARGCGQCEFCTTGDEFMCIRLRVLGERLPGTYAEYVKVAAQNCFPIPAGWSFSEAASLPLVFITLWRMLITNGRLNPGESVLIVGVGGGVASAALQVAKAIGARVLVTSGSDAKLARAAALGADAGVNHFASDYAEFVAAETRGRGVDVVVDCVGGPVWKKSLASLAPEGRLVTCGATAGGEPEDDIAAIFSKELKIYGSTLGSRKEFRRVLQFVRQKGLKPIVDRIFPLAEAAAAQRYLEEARQFGKVALSIPA